MARKPSILHTVRHDKDTIIALATATGISSIGIIRISGSEAFAAVDGLFRGRQTLTGARSHSLLYGNLHSGTEQAAEVLDEVVLSVYRGPKSYTGEDVVEISCHGSPYILRRVLAALQEAGLRYAEAGEFTQRAFLNGRLDLVQAEAVIDLIEAQSDRAHTAAMRQLKGHFSSQIETFRQELIDFASLVELELDFAEEDVQFANRAQMDAFVRRMLAHVGSLVASFRTGQAVRSGIATVIVGAPNVGKSTLLNLLLGEERAIVSPIAGTTRDTIEDTMQLGGWLFRFIDTAGLRATSDTIEALGIERSRQQIAKADLILYVLDINQLGIGQAKAATALLKLEADLQALDSADTPILLIGNKADVLATQGPMLSEIDTAYGKVMPMAAQTGDGLEALKAEILAKTEALHLAATDSIVTNHRHFACLSEAQTSLQAVLDGLEAGTSPDWLAQDIRQALYHLGQITGQITADDLLGNIFSRFCIGK